MWHETYRLEPPGLPRPRRLRRPKPWLEGRGDGGRRRRSPPSGVDLYNFACVAAVVAGTTRPDSPEPADEAAEQALRWLRRAFDVGTFRDPGMIRALDDDADLASIRTHRGFRLLRLDAAFPAEPFAAGR